jgi:hypothetical protein
MIITIIIIALLIEIFLKPRLDFTKDRALVLWYVKKIRKYIILTIL